MGFNFLFVFPPGMLPSVVPRLATDLAVRVFPGVWKLLSVLRPPSLSLLSLFLSFIFFSYLFSKTMGFFSGCLMSSASIQKLFCGIYSALKCSFDEFVGGRGELSPHPIPPPSSVLSPFDSPLLLLITSVSLLPLLFSM